MVSSSVSSSTVTVLLLLVGLALLQDSSVLPSARAFVAVAPLAVPRSSTTVGLWGTAAPPLQQQRQQEEEEMVAIDYTARFNLEQVLARQAAAAPLTVAEAATRHGMPWKSSIDPTAFVDEKELLYMPFWEWHLQFMQDNLTNLKVVSCTNGETDFTYNENVPKKARIVNLCLSSDEYRKIRLTYYDAGVGAQVYNAVLYPDPSYNLPILGADFLCFHRKKYLAICDFQPLHADESHHDALYSSQGLLHPIKDSYPNLKGRMSSKFYDETQFFSPQMLFSRFEDESIIQNELFPAFQQYCQTHLDLVRACQEKQRTATTTDDTTEAKLEQDQQSVLERQQAYDTYSAARDPATGLFAAMFGESWAMDYVHDFLFSMSQRPEPGSPMPMPSMGGPPATAVTGNPVAAAAPATNPFAATPHHASSATLPRVAAIVR